MSSSRQCVAFESLRTGRRTDFFSSSGCRLASSVCSDASVKCRACVCRVLHEAVYQEGVWKTVFYQEDPEELAPVLQNDALRVKYQLVNPQPVVLPETKKKEVPTEQVVEQEESMEETVTPGVSEPSSQASNVNKVSLKDLSLLYKITERQGWYVNKDGLCYFIRFNDSSKKEYDVIFDAINTTDLDSLIRQVD